MDLNDKNLMSGREQEDGRSREWEDRGRVALPEDLDPDGKTSIERDFEPEKPKEPKPANDTAY